MCNGYVNVEHLQRRNRYESLIKEFIALGEAKLLPRFALNTDAMDRMGELYVIFKHEFNKDIFIAAKQYKEVHKL